MGNAVSQPPQTAPVSTVAAGGMVSSFTASRQRASLLDSHGRPIIPPSSDASSLRHRGSSNPALAPSTLPVPTSAANTGESAANNKSNNKRKGKISLFDKVLAASPKDWLVHEVDPQDTLAGVALKYGVTLTEIKRANKMWADNLNLYTRLVVPVTASEFLKAKNMIAMAGDKNEQFGFMLPNSRKSGDKTGGEWLAVRERDGRTHVGRAEIDKSELVSRFVALSRCGDERIAIRFLERKRWNFPRALGAYFAFQSRTMSSGHADDDVGTTAQPRLDEAESSLGKDDATTADENETDGTESDAATRASIRARLLSFIDSDDEDDDDDDGEYDAKITPDTSATSFIAAPSANVAEGWSAPSQNEYLSLDSTKGDDLAALSAGDASPRFRLRPDEIARSERYIVVGKDIEHDDDRRLPSGPVLDDPGARAARANSSVVRRLQQENDDMFAL